MAGNPEDNTTSAQLIELMRERPREGFSKLFDLYFEEVCGHVYRYIPDARTAQDVAQDLFVELWTKRDKLNISTSPGAYLHRMAVSRALNYIRDNKKHQYTEVTQLRVVKARIPSVEEVMDADQMSVLITQTIDELPDRCRQVFMMSRFEELSNAEIASALDISVKTVENQMTKALRAIREAVTKFKGSE